MKQYEVTFIVDPVLSGDEIKATAKTYVDMLGNGGCTIVHTEEMGLRQLAYQIKRRATGIYYCVEFQTETGNIITETELAMRRDDNILRFLTAKLDKYGVKYNDDRRNGLIKKAVRPERKEDKNDRGRGNRPNRKPRPPRKEEAPKVEAPKTEAPKVEKATPAPVVAKKEEE